MEPENIALLHQFELLEKILKLTKENLELKKDINRMCKDISEKLEKIENNLVESKVVKHLKNEK